MQQRNDATWDTGCRTAVMFSAEDLGCYWQYATKYVLPNRNPQLTRKVLRATQVGTNVVAYATGMVALAARDNGLPLVVHTREADDDTAALLSPSPGDLSSMYWVAEETGGRLMPGNSPDVSMRQFEEAATGAIGHHGSRPRFAPRSPKSAARKLA